MKTKGLTAAALAALLAGLESPTHAATAARLSTFGVRNPDTVCLDPRNYFSVNQLRTA